MGNAETGCGTTHVDVLIPTCGRPAALAVTLTAVMAQTFRDYRVVVSDQSRDEDVDESPVVAAVARLLDARGTPVEFHKHLPNRGMAEQRAYLLSQARAPYALFIDDDVILEPDALGRLVDAITVLRCGFVGNAVIGLSYAEDVRTHEQSIEFWDGQVQPEHVAPGTPQWERWRLHNAANLWHVQRALALAPGEWRAYRVAWTGGCVLYDTAGLRAVGGFDFWTQLPREHAGEDVLAQLRVMRVYGGCGVVPSGAYHQEVATRVHDRRVDAPKVLSI